MESTFAQLQLLTGHVVTMLENKIHCTFEDACIFDGLRATYICMHILPVEQKDKLQLIYVATVWASLGESSFTWHVMLVLHRNTATG